MVSVDFTERPAFIGARVLRIEDDRLLTGRGQYVADIQLPGVADVAMVRSPLAHARINEIRLDSARAAPGVLAVVTASDLTGMSTFPHFHTWAPEVPRFPLCRDRARYVGAPIVAVVAEDRYVAEDAAELVEIDFDELPPIDSVDSALAPEAPVLYEGWDDNRMVEAHIEDTEVERILATSRIVRGRYSMPRHFSVPMETRGVAAEFRAGRFTIWTTSQIPHIARTTISAVLNVSERDIRLIAPDVGGGFGGKAVVYSEDALVPWLARHLDRPVRFIEDRAEHMIAAAHARENVHEIEAAVDDQGRILAMRVRIWYDVGTQEIFPLYLTPSFTGWAIMTGAYRIPHAAATITNVVTTKTPTGAYRGFGMAEAVFAMERLIDKAATEVGVDPVEARRRMLVSPEELPYILPSGVRLDSGSHRESLDRAEELGKAALQRARERFKDDPDARVGVGYVCYIEANTPTWFGTTGHWAAYDSCTIRVDPDGGVVVGVGVMTTGQGVETMVATVAGGILGVPISDVTVVMGDTDRAPYGLGAWGSRTAAVAGGAIRKAATEVREKVLTIAAHMLEAAREDLVIEEGQIHVRGSDRPSVAIAQVANAASVRTVDLPPDMGPGLEATATYEPPNLDHVPDEGGRMNAAATYGNSAHAAVVKVDIITGAVEIVDYIAIHDCGTVINPIIVEGQVHGAVAQGIGGALYEAMPYTAEGQPLATTFMDYLIPTATEIPLLTTEHFETPSELPFGVKGVGEGGIVGPAAAIGNAISHALEEFGVDITTTPITPPMVRRLIREAVGSDT